MGRKRAPSEAVLTDSTNSAISAQTHAGEHSSQGTHAGKFVPVTFSRKAKVPPAACEGDAFVVATVADTAAAVSCPQQ